MKNIYTNFKRTTLAAVLLLFGSFAITQNAMATSITWTGATSTAWNDITNWSPQQLPTASDPVAIYSGGNQPVIGPTVTADVLTLAINAGANLTIQSDATGTGSLFVAFGVSGNGTVTIERYIPVAATWYLISSPIQNIVQTTFGAAYAENDGAVTDRKYAVGNYLEGTDTWGYAQDNSINELDVAKGYSIKVKTGLSGSKIIFSGLGDKVNVGNKQVGVNKAGNGWNLIGNPFTSAIKAKGAGGFLVDNDAKIQTLYKGLYLWDHNVNDYVVIAESGFTFPAPGGEGQLSEDNIAVGQGFFIKAAGAGLVDFNATQQVHSTGAAFKSAETIDPAVRLTVQSGSLSNRVVVGFKSGLSAGLDPGYDVGKFKANTNLALYSQLMDGSSTVDFEIQGLPNVDYTSLSVPLGMNFKGGDVVFTLETNETFPKEALVYIEDTQLNTRTLLNAEGANYSVTLPALTASNRFNLVITGYKSGQINTGVGVEKQNNLIVYTRDRAIYVNGIADANDVVAVYGIDGKLHHRKAAGVAGLLQIDAASYPAGIYMVSIQQKESRATRKVVISE